MTGLWSLGLALAILHSWPRRFGLNNLDAVSYLDIADAWRTGHWQVALNTYWSPAYSWALAAAFAVVRPAAQHEYVLLHIVNLALFCVAMGALHLLIVEIVRAAPTSGRAVTFSPASYSVLAVMLFLWLTIVQFGVWRESPDLIPSAATFAASAMVLRLRRTRDIRAALALGVILGIGYLGKAAMLPVAPVFVLAAAWAARPAWRTTIVAASLALAAVAGPWMLALSIATGRPTFGDSGRINYLWYVNRSENWPRHWPPHWPHWDGVEGRGAPVRAARRMHDRPAVYEFAAPFVSATYPMWYAPGYWYEGVAPRFDWRDQARRLKLSAGDLIETMTVTRDHSAYFNPQPALMALLLVLWFGGHPRRWRPEWTVLLPVLSVIGLYAAVRIAPRFVTAPLLVIWLVALAGVRLEPGLESRRLLRGATIAGVFVLAAALLVATIGDVSPGLRRVLRGEPDAENVPWNVASVLREAGVTRDTPVGIIGNAQAASRWARLAKVRIVAETPAADLQAVAEADREVLDAVVAAFRQTPARLILAERLPPAASEGEWTPIVGTPYSLRWLDR